jgi:acyl-CoA synthetase (AMP-forming)/AMP-acid ligase II
MPRSGDDLVDGTLARWARVLGDRAAIIEGETRLNFDALEQAVARRAASLVGARAASAVLVEDHGSTTQRLVDFLGIVRSGRCAAVADRDWPEPVRTRVRQTLPALPSDASGASGNSPFYIGYTSGSTGHPKGFMRDHRSWVESFRVCIETFGQEAAGRVLAPGGLSHSLFLFGMLLGLWTGGGIVVQPRFSAARALSSLETGEASCLVAVPSQLVTMLDHALRRGMPPIDSVRLVMIGGARWMRQRTHELRALFPNARLVEFYGASETSFVAWMDADEDAPANAVGRPFANVQVEIRRPSGTDPTGMIFVRSPMLFTDYVGAEDDATAALRDNGWLSVRDMGYLDAEGRLCLVGRQNRMIVTSGRNLFPEEVEAVLAAFPGVEAASVQGVADPVRGLAVVALLNLQPALQQAAPDAASLVAWCREHLDPYKVPRRFLVCDRWPLTASGKTDHVALGGSVRTWADVESWPQVLR